MPIRLTSAVTLGAVALFTAGCIGPFGRSAPPPQMRAQAPAPLPSAPTGTVTTSTLPPPPGTVPGTTQPSLASLGGAQPGVSGTGAPPAGTVDVARTDLLGGWTLASAGESCQLFMTLTTWSGGYRASTRGCTNAALQKVSAWNMEGRQIMLLNDSGGTVARLYPSSRTQFSGSTEGGGPVSVTR